MNPYRCKGDDPNCEEVMRFDEGYEEAVNKAVDWIFNHNGDNEVVEQFKKAMEL